MAVEPTETRWLLLIHQIPPKPNYLRIKIGRRLQRLGAVAIKNSVYVLPRTDQAHEDFEWVTREIVKGRGEASVCEARFLEGLSDDQIEALFNAARQADYLEIAKKARDLGGLSKRGRKIDEERRGELEAGLGRLRKRLSPMGPALPICDARNTCFTRLILIREVGKRARIEIPETGELLAIQADAKRAVLHIDLSGIHGDEIPLM